MPNPHRGEVEVSLCGRRRVIRFDMNKLIQLQERLEADGLADLQVKLTTMSLVDLRWLVWLAIEPDGADQTKPTEDEIGKAIGVELSMGQLFDAVKKALDLSFRGPESEREQEPAKEGETGSDPLPEREAAPGVMESG